MSAARVPGVERVRISSIEVIHVRDSVLEALAREPKVCPHLHVPLQSGDDGVLAAMGRHYDAGEYLETIARLRDAVPHINVTTDVIVGFPNEDDEAFQRTLELVEEAGISRVHTFSYSSRPGHCGGGARRPRGAGGEEAPLAGDAGPLGGALAPAPQPQARRAASGCWWTRSPTRSARATPRTTPAVTCRPGPAAAGEVLDVNVHELHADGLLVTPA